MRANQKSGRVRKYEVQETRILLKKIDILFLGFDHRLTLIKSRATLAKPHRKTHPRTQKIPARGHPSREKLISQRTKMQVLPDPFPVRNKSHVPRRYALSVEEIYRCRVSFGDD